MAIQICVCNRCGYIFMTKQLLDDSDVNSPLQQVGRILVSQRVRMNIHKPSFLCEYSYFVPDTGAGQTEYLLIRTPVFYEIMQLPGKVWQEWYHPVLLPFALPHHQKIIMNFLYLKVS